MEIEFSPNQVPVARVNTQAKGPQPATAPEQPPLQGMAELQRKLNDMALTRPDQMQSVQQALSDVKYPPDELLNGIAHLLAIKLTQ
ncbi:MAG TPA: hypothetical protein VKY92_01380 [Verrucomicrobiae bacterium]|nr:hypothetical protein [Verrucomicrobiae bacterium]